MAYKRHNMERVQQYVGINSPGDIWRCVNCGVVYHNPFRAMLDDVCELPIEAKE